MGVTQGSLILPTTPLASLSFPIRLPKYLLHEPPSLKNPIAQVIIHERSFSGPFLNMALDT